jgi:hypothetical protein
MTKPLVFSGILTIIPFCVAVRYLFPIFGVWVGTLVSYVLVAPLAFLSYYAVKHQNKDTNPLLEPKPPKQSGNLFLPENAIVILKSQQVIGF